MAQSSSSNLRTHTGAAIRPGTSGYRGRLTPRSLNVPAGPFHRSGSASRTCSRAAILLLGAVPAVCLAAEGGEGTHFFDVPAGGVLASLVTAAVAMLSTWGVMRNRPPRARASTVIEDQPLRVREDKLPSPVELCNERHRNIDSSLSNIFGRIAIAEARAAALEASLDAINKAINSMDSKLDKLISRR